MSKISSFANTKDCSAQKEFLSFEKKSIPKGAANCSSGNVFVIKGTLPALTKEKAKKLIEEYGGEITSTIDDKTNIIIKGCEEWIQVPKSSKEYKEYIQYIGKKCDLQTNLLNYLDNSQNVEENYLALTNIIKDQKISKDKIELTDLLQLISKISINHQRSPYFFNKIEKVLTIFTEKMREYYSNDALFKFLKTVKEFYCILFKKN